MAARGVGITRSAILDWLHIGPHPLCDLSDGMVTDSAWLRGRDAAWPRGEHLVDHESGQVHPRKSMVRYRTGLGGEKMGHTSCD